AEYYDSTTGQWTPISTNTGQYYYVNPNTGAAVLYNPNAKSTFLGYGGSNPNFNDPMFAGNALAPSYGADPLDTQVRGQKAGEVVNAVNGILMVGGVAIPIINLGASATTSTVSGLGRVSGSATGSFGETWTASVGNNIKNSAVNDIGLAGRGYVPAAGERTIQGFVESVVETMGGNPTIGRNGQDLFRLRASGHGSSTATATPQNVMNVNPITGQVFPSKGSDVLINNYHITETYKALNSYGNSYIRTLNGLR
ncbi:hypothetical protein WJT86_12250, partial [Microvirga sp. W0021]